MREESSVFIPSKTKTKTYPVVGLTTVYMGRDENLGKCLIHSSNFLTPNMPKLFYAVDFAFSESDEKIKLTGILNPEIEKFKAAYVFEKRDGFNCLFYLYKGRVIPKTRVGPIASGEIQQVINLPEFPVASVRKMLDNDLVPVFEVWGAKLDELDIVHGSVDAKAVQEEEGLPDINFDLVAVMEIGAHGYSYLSPDRIIKIADEYDLKPAKFHGIIDVNFREIKEVMDNCEEANRKRGTIITEGRVLHCYDYNSGEYQMFKVKPFSIMEKDVAASNRTISRERIKLEISKVLLETDVLEIVRNPSEYIREVLDYLSEDYKMTNKISKKVNEIFVDVVAREFSKKYPDFCEEPWKYGASQMLIGAIKQRRDRK